MPSQSTEKRVKYWTACIGQFGSLTATGLPFTNLREAVAAKHLLHSRNAVVVLADANGMPTNQVIR